MPHTKVEISTQTYRVRSMTPAQDKHAARETQTPWWWRAELPPPRWGTDSPSAWLRAGSRAVVGKMWPEEVAETCPRGHRTLHP